MAVTESRVGSSAATKFFLTLIVGAASGFILGVLVMAIEYGHSPSQSDSAAPRELATPQPTERWFIWDGAAPLIGQPFRTEADCEAARKQTLAITADDANKQLKAMGNLTFGQVQALGYNPMDRVNASVEQVMRAYCRRTSE